MGRRLNIVPIPALGDSSLGRAGGFHGLISNRGRARRLAPRELLPPVLAVTIYNGRKVWTALDDVFDLIEPVQGWLSRRQPRLRHLALDLRALARQPLPESNVVSWIARRGTQAGTHHLGLPANEAEVRRRDSRASFQVAGGDH